MTMAGQRSSPAGNRERMKYQTIPETRHGWIPIAHHSLAPLQNMTKTITIGMEELKGW